MTATTGCDLLIREARDGDAASLAPRLRQADRDELLAGTGQEPLAALLDGYRRSHIVRSVVAGGDVVGMFGIVALDTEGTGLVWLMALRNSWPTAAGSGTSQSGRYKILWSATGWYTTPWMIAMARRCGG
jgi:hypothetical protein